MTTVSELTPVVTGLEGDKSEIIKDSESRSSTTSTLFDKEQQLIQGEIPDTQDGADNFTSNRRKVIDAYEELLFKPDIEALDVAMATILANRVGGDPVAIFLVLASASGKSETIMAFADLPDTYWVSTITPNTLASGLDSQHSEGGRETALLSNLDAEGKRTLLLKEFGSILSMRPDERKELIGQLRDILDGYYKKSFGTGKVVEWRGTLGMLAGVVPKIETQYSVIASLGDRWLMVRPNMPEDRLELAMEAMDRVGDEEELRKELREAMAGLFSILDETDLGKVTCLQELRRSIAAAASALTLLRTPVERNDRKQVVYVSTPEGPARVAKALWKLSKCLAIVRGRWVVAEEDVQTIYKVCADSLPSIRRRILEVLARQLATIAEIERATNLSEATIRYQLEELEMLEAVSKKAIPTESPGRPAQRYVLNSNLGIFLTPYHQTEIK